MDAIVYVEKAEGIYSVFLGDDVEKTFSSYSEAMAYALKLARRLGAEIHYRAATA